MAEQQLEWPSKRVRDTFINFFKDKKDHVFWPSSPVVPVNDPTLLFANSGMTQYKPIFLGTCDPSLDMNTLKRAANTQKCIRAGGKHNDLDDVGKDVYHHTFFEMLGNWSFGDYFKQEAIDWAWECLTVEFGMKKDRMYATYFGGDDKLGLPPDDEARDMWLKYLPADRIIPSGVKDNFWEMGPTGPCGPCSEIHYDRIGGRDASKLVNADLPDVIEIWNIVFMQFNREADGSLRNLPNKHIDTGMGFERLTSILQDKDSNYDTDIFLPIFAEIQKITGREPYTGRVGAEDVGLKDMAYRVVADHIRTLTFAIADGCVPSSDGRGYVLRRILRRAVRYGTEILELPNGFMATLCPIVPLLLGDVFPEIRQKEAFVKSIIMDEENSFVRTLDAGVKHLRKVTTTMIAAGETVVPAQDAHFLFSSMGFPLDLTELMAEEKGLTVDSEGFQQLMEKDRQISEQAEKDRKGGGDKDMTLQAEQTAWLMDNSIVTTDSLQKYTWHVSPKAKVLAVFMGRGQGSAGFEASASSSDGLIGVVLDTTSFYYESGGQIFDTGVLEFVSNGINNSTNTNTNTNFTVSSCQTYAGYVVHTGTLPEGCSVTVGDEVTVKVDYERRSNVAPNHTMTHVLNYALRSVLLSQEERGSETNNLCEQKGSLVDEGRMRFDFSFGSSLTVEQVTQTQDLVNKVIVTEMPVYSELVPLTSAKNIKALRCVFGEKYPDPVRVISVGQAVESIMANPDNDEWYGYSIEFCGGTHLENTKQAEAFVIVEETGIAKGIRRITGLTRGLAKKAVQEADALMTTLSSLQLLPGGLELLAGYKELKALVDSAVISLVSKNTLRVGLQGIWETQIKVYLKTIAAVKAADAEAQATTVGNQSLEAGKDIMAVQFDFGADVKVSKKIQEKLKAVNPEGSFFIATLDDEGEKIGLYPLVSKHHQDTRGMSAKLWMDHCFQVVGVGKGGGKADTAMGNIPSGGQAVLDQVLAAANQYIANLPPPPN